MNICAKAIGPIIFPFTLICIPTYKLEFALPILLSLLPFTLKLASVGIYLHTGTVSFSLEYISTITVSFIKNLKLKKITALDIRSLHQFSHIIIFKKRL